MTVKMMKTKMVCPGKSRLSRTLQTKKISKQTNKTRKQTNKNMVCPGKSRLSRTLQTKKISKQTNETRKQTKIWCAQGKAGSVGLCKNIPMLLV